MPVPRYDLLFGISKRTAIGNLIVIEIKGITPADGLQTLQAVPGLEYFLDSELSNGYLATILSNVNPFVIWYVIILTIGISVVSQLKKWKSAVIVSSLWFIGVVFQVAIKYLSASIQQMMGR